MKELKNNLKFIWNYSKDSKIKIILLALLNFFKICTNIIIPIISAKQIINLTNNELYEVILIASVILIINLINRFLDYYINKLGDIIYINMTGKITKDLAFNILKLENETLNTNSSGIFIQRLTNDKDILSDGFNTIIDHLEGIVGSIGVFIAVLIINKYVFIYLIIEVIILDLINIKKTEIHVSNKKIFKKENEKMVGFTGELVRGAKDIKMLNSEKSFSKEIINRTDNLNSLFYKHQEINRKYNYLLRGTKDIFDFGLILFVIVLILNDLLNITNALIIYNYSNKVNVFFRSYASLKNYLKELGLSINRIEEIINGDKFKKEKFGDIHLNKVEGNFEFKNVTFSYKNDTRKILDNLSFKVKANETVAFVGKTGVGKTTLFNLLCKMYDIDNGEILIDNHNIKDLDKDSIRGNITIISQNPYIFNVSIKDNFRLVKENVTDSEIKKACKMACLDEFIEKLPNKYDTLIGEGGVNLSGGEKQRLAIARALIQKTEIILFDEATSALDNETQLNIQKAIDSLKNNYTILIIAHRLSTIINANKILFLGEGKIIAEGTHKELLKNCKEYQKLYESEIKNRN